MQQDEDADIFFSRVQQLVEELESVGGPVSQNGLLEVLLTSLPEEYSRIPDKTRLAMARTKVWKKWSARCGSSTSTKSRGLSCQSCFCESSFGHARYPVWEQRQTQERKDAANAER